MFDLSILHIHSTFVIVESGNDGIHVSEKVFGVTSETQTSSMIRFNVSDTSGNGAFSSEKVVGMTTVVQISSAIDELWLVSYSSFSMNVELVIFAVSLVFSMDTISYVGSVDSIANVILLLRSSLINVYGEVAIFSIVIE